MHRTQTPRSTILIVDDSPTNRTFVRTVLEQEGHEVILADCGEAALVAFESNDVDCVVLDIAMPGMDGFEVHQRLRGLPRGNDVPVVFFSALRELEVFARARALGIDYLVKPARPSELALRVQTALYTRVLARQRALEQRALHRDQLMESLVHELKNVVNSLELNAELLARDSGLSARGRRVVGTIRSELQALLRTLLGLLEVGRRGVGEHEVDRGEDTSADTTVCVWLPDSR